MTAHEYAEIIDDIETFIRNEDYHQELMDLITENKEFLDDEVVHEIQDVIRSGSKSDNVKYTIIRGLCN